MHAYQPLPAPQVSIDEVFDHRSIADVILKSFNTWAYKREQPSDPVRLREAICRSLVRRRPIEFVLYWGKGPRSYPADPERQCFAYLSGMRDRIAKVAPCPVVITLLATDTHARLNGYADDDIGTYYGAIEAEARTYGFDVQRLSSVTGDHAPSALVEGPPEDGLIEALAMSAAKWYRGDLSPIDAAKTYFEMNMAEKRAVGSAYDSSIFVTFNSSKLRQLFPAELPIFYMYSIRKGIAVKPWFMPTGDEHSRGIDAPVHAGF